MFRPDGDDVVLELDDVGRDVLDSLARQVAAMLQPDHAPPTDPLAVMVGIDPDAERPDDPALARLLPDAFVDDPEASAEFRRFTEVEIRQRKVADAQDVRETLATPGPWRMDGDRARRWLGFLNDVRLVFGTRLAVTEDPVELSEDDPLLPAFSVYGWLGMLQETLVESLVPRHP